MKAMRLIHDGRGSLLELCHAPVPVPRTGQVLIRVAAAGVIPAELGWYPTTHHVDGSVRVGAVPGHEFCGTVAEIAGAGGGFHVGESVYGMNGWFEDGATAEFCLAEPAALALQPGSLSVIEAATVPISALTAMQALFDRAQLQPGERVLVHGGAGSVGAYAVQLAALHGAKVVATCGAAAMEYVRGLGACECVDFERERFEERVRPVDVVFDTVGGDTLERSWTVLAPGGRAVTVASDAESSADPRVKEAFLLVAPSGASLVSLAELFASRTLRPAVKATVPLEEAGAAYAKRVPGGFGKVAVVVGG